MEKFNRDLFVLLNKVFNTLFLIPVVSLVLAMFGKPLPEQVEVSKKWWADAAGLYAQLNAMFAREALPRMVELSETLLAKGVALGLSFLHLLADALLHLLPVLLGCVLVGWLGYKFILPHYPRMQERVKSYLPPLE